MLLYLIRHADALSGAEDQTRPLSPRGRADVLRLARFFRDGRRFTPAQVWHSPLTRARETAQLLLDSTARETPLIETVGLLPEDDPSDMAARVASPTLNTHLALVGHEPFMSALAALLARGKEGYPLFEVRKGAVLAFQRTGVIHKKTGLPRWALSWHITPELLPNIP
jgi:phosphohistidine phosphatase